MEFLVLVLYLLTPANNLRCFIILPRLASDSLSAFFFGNIKMFSYLCNARGHGGKRVVPLPRENRAAMLEVWTP